MYIESKGDDGLVGPARIGRVTYSKTGESVYLRARMFATLGGTKFKSNYLGLESCTYFGISRMNCSHDQKGQERNGNRVNVLRPRHADAERKPDAWHADRIEQFAAEKRGYYRG